MWEYRKLQIERKKSGWRWKENNGPIWWVLFATMHQQTSSSRVNMTCTSAFAPHNTIEHTHAKPSVSALECQES